MEGRISSSYGGFFCRLLPCSRLKISFRQISPFHVCLGISVARIQNSTTILLAVKNFFCVRGGLCYNFTTFFFTPSPSFQNQAEIPFIRPCTTQISGSPKSREKNPPPLIRGNERGQTEFRGIYFSKLSAFCTEKKDKYF